MNKQRCLGVIVLPLLLICSSDNAFARDCGSSCSSSSSSCCSSANVSSTNCGNSCSSSCFSNLGSACGNACDDCWSTSFLRPRPLSQNMVLQNGLSFYDRYFKSDYPNDCGDECRRWFQYDTRIFYYHSTRRDKTAKALLPHCKDVISTAEQGQSDINSLWLKIIADSEPSDDVDDLTIYNACFSLRPQRKVVGAAFYGRLNFGDLCDMDCLNPWWLSVYVPVARVKHDLNLCQQNNNNVQGQDCSDCNKSIIAALTNQDRDFQRFYCDDEKKPGVDDVLIQFGYDAYLCDCWSWGMYGLVFAPSGDRSDSRLAFEPVLGTGHTGLGFGFYGDTVISECEDTLWTFLYNFRYAYFLKRKECRTFDLCNAGDWSRNLLVVRENSESNPNAQVEPLPGVNFLTTSVDVKLRSTIEFWLAFHYEHCNWNVEFGYDFWWKQREKICFDKCTQLCDRVGVLDIAGVVCRGEAVSATENAKICEVTFNPINPASDAEFTPITIQNLNPSSAESPSASSSQFYIAGSYDWNFCDYPVSTGLGVSYEVGHGRGALSQVGVWALIGAMF